jgi:hypothetical protein
MAACESELSSDCQPTDSGSTGASTRKKCSRGCPDTGRIARRLDMRITLRSDAEQAKRTIYGGNRMARRRFQLGSLFQRGKRPRVWVARWWEEIIKPDGSIGRRRRAEVLGTVAELRTRSKAMEALSRLLNPINSGMKRPQSTRTFSSFVREEWLPVTLPTVKYATQKNYRYILDVHLLPTFGKHRLCDINRESIQSFLLSSA